MSIGLATVANLLNLILRADLFEYLGQLFVGKLGQSFRWPSLTGRSRYRSRS